MSKERLRQNKSRVLDIYGIPKERHKEFNIHHINYISDCNSYVDTDGKSNLFPMTRPYHDLFHAWANIRDHGILEPLPEELKKSEF